MKTSTVLLSILSAWVMTIGYYQIEVMTGVQLKPLLFVAIITMTVGIYLGCRDEKETDKEES